MNVGIAEAVDKGSERTLRMADNDTSSDVAQQDESDM